MFLESYTNNFRKADRYSANGTSRAVNFTCIAPQAKAVSVIGDFNNWEPNANPMQHQPDGGWIAKIALHHGHHQYLFLVDGVPVLDPRASGISRNAKNERVNLVAVS
jgi:1,4-alpha-glucan branching enzyme